MAKFKVLKEFVLNGIVQKFDTIIELDHVRAGLKSIQDFIESVPEGTAVSGSSDGSALSELKPGQETTEETKKKLSEENAKATTDAHAQAADQRGKDLASGEEKPAVAAVADTIKDQLENKEFKKPAPAEEPAPETPPATPPEETTPPATPETPPATPEATQPEGTPPIENPPI